MVRGLRALLAAAAVLGGFSTMAQAASTFYIRGGGDGHGIGMSQYGAYGYALHGAGYQTILAHYYQGTALATTDARQTVRVLLATGQASFSGAASVSGAATRLAPSTTYTVKAAGSRLTITNPAGKPVGTFAAPLIVTAAAHSPAPLSVPGLGSYRGSLQFSPAGGGVQTIDAVGLDDYVRGVVAAEMPSSWAVAALEAQAVAARTYAITTTVDGNGYDLYSDTRSQVYGGVKAETPSTDAAVAATAGQIVTYAGKPAVTYFFASSGGYTESIQNVWAGATPEPWLRGVPDPYDNVGQNPYHSWGSQMSLAAAGRKLGRLVKGSLVGIAVTRHGVSPRIVAGADRRHPRHQHRQRRPAPGHLRPRRHLGDLHLDHHHGPAGPAERHRVPGARRRLGDDPGTDVRGVARRGPGRGVLRWRLQRAGAVGPLPGGRRKPRRARRHRPLSARQRRRIACGGCPVRC